MGMMGDAESAFPREEPTAQPLEAAVEFESFFRQQSDQVFRALWLVTGNRTEAEEITQDAFVTAWERWDRVSVMENPTGYVFRTAMNLFRKRCRRTVLAARKAVRPVLREDEFAAADDREVVRTTLSALTPRQRAAIVMTDLLSFSSEEAGQTLGIRAGTVRSLVAQGRRTFRAALEGDDA
jgi:RNA polymerase sigma-70 factor (ECF subfamily)